MIRSLTNQGGKGSLATLLNRKVKQPTQTRPTKYSDEFVKEVIRAKRAGATYKALAEKYGVYCGLVRAWCQGTNRKLCLNEVLKEKV